MKPSEEILHSLARHAEGRATREDIICLEEALAGDADFASYMVEYLHLDAALDEFAPQQGSVALTAPRAVRRHGWRWPAAMAAAAALTVAGLVFWQMNGNVPAAPGVMARVIEAEKVTLPGMSRGKTAELRDLKLPGGHLTLELESGVRITFNGRCEASFESAMHVRLATGRVTVDVGERGKGFMLDTLETRVVDLGTRFGVETGDDGRTDVVVFEGSVELYESNAEPGAAALARLEQGQAMSVRAQRRLERIASITGGDLPSQWTAGPPPAQCVIRAVNDNFDSAAHGFFYRIEPGGMKAGATAYVDWPFTWEAAPGIDFPTELAGADLVQTFRGGRRSPRLNVEVTVDRPVELFVLMPAIAVPPDWLRRDFTRSENRLQLDGSTAGRRRGMAFDVWRRVVDAPGVVTLGAAPRDARGRMTAMYGIAARPLRSGGK